MPPDCHVIQITEIIFERISRRFDSKGCLSSVHKVNVDHGGLTKGNQTRAVCKTRMPPKWAVYCSESNCVNTLETI